MFTVGSSYFNIRCSKPLGSRTTSRPHAFSSAGRYDGSSAESSTTSATSMIGFAARPARVDPMWHHAASRPR